MTPLVLQVDTDVEYVPPSLGWKDVVPNCHSSVQDDDVVPLYRRKAKNMTNQNEKKGRGADCNIS